jgi:hypothetical protein
MPLKLNVGLSRKVGDANYGSRGASVNVEMELDPTLVTDQEKLKDRIRHLFGSLRSSLAEELNGNGTHQSPAENPPRNGNGHPNSNGNDHPTTPPVRPATNSQVKAIHAIARSQGIDVRAAGVHGPD